MACLPRVAAKAWFGAHANLRRRPHDLAGQRDRAHVCCRIRHARAQLDFVYYLEGREQQARAVEESVEAFLRTPERSKWDFR